MRRALSPLLALVAACAATGGDPWRRSTEVFREGDVVASVDAVRRKDGVELRWVGVRAEGASRLREVRLILFCDANSDGTAQPEEQLTRWNAHADAPVEHFSATASFEATNLKPDVLAALCVFTEVAIEGLPEPVQQVRKLP